jgi:hypothetical protein
MCRFEFLKWAFQWPVTQPVATAADRPDGQVVPVLSARTRVLRSREAAFLDGAEAVQLLPDYNRNDEQGGHLLDSLFPGEKPFSRIKFSNQRPEADEREVNSAGPDGDVGAPVGSKSWASSRIQGMAGDSLGPVAISSFGKVTQHGFSEFLRAQYLQIIANIISYLV